MYRPQHTQGKVISGGWDCHSTDCRRAWDHPKCASCKNLQSCRIEPGHKNKTFGINLCHGCSGLIMMGLQNWKGQRHLTLLGTKHLHSTSEQLKVARILKVFLGHTSTSQSLAFAVGSLPAFGLLKFY